MEYLQTQQEFNKSGCFRKMQNKFFQICDEIKEEFCDKLSDIVWKRKGVFFELLIKSIKTVGNFLVINVDKEIFSRTYNPTFKPCCPFFV